MLRIAKFSLLVCCCSLFCAVLCPGFLFTPPAGAQGIITGALTGFIQDSSGAVIPNVLPAALLVIAAAVIVWLAIKGTRFGIGIYAVGSDEEAARSAGIPVRLATPQPPLASPSPEKI